MYIQDIFFSKSRNKRFQCCDQWKKSLWSTKKKNDKITYDKIWKIATGQGDDYAIGCLLDYIYFRENYNPTTIDLSKQQKLDADTKAIQQINFKGNLEQDGNTQMFFITELAKESVLNFSKRTVKVLRFYFKWLNITR